MTTINVRPYTRRLPEKAPDPFAPVMEARKQAYARKWGVELEPGNESRSDIEYASWVRRARRAWKIMTGIES